MSIDRIPKLEEVFDSESAGLFDPCSADECCSSILWKPGIGTCCWTRGGVDFCWAANRESGGVPPAVRRLLLCQPRPATVRAVALVLLPLAASTASGSMMVLGGSEKSICFRLLAEFRGTDFLGPQQ